MIAIGLTLYWHWTYATKGHRLVESDIDPGFVRSVKQVILMGPVVYLAAIGLSFASPFISILLYLMVNLLYIIPGGAHLYMKQQ